MKTLLEKAIVHLLNGDENKAAALFHKFMVERARQIHESLRQDDGSDETLDENWDSEITEEEYFGDEDMADEHAPTMDGGDADMADRAPEGDMGGDMGGDEMGDAPVDGADAMGGEGDMDGDEFGGEGEDLDSEPGVEGKIDELTDKIDQLTAEFDRMMSELHDEDPDADFGSEEGAMDVSDDSGDDSFGDDADETEDNNDLAGRMENDMADEDDAPDHKPVAEGEMPDFLKKKGDDEEDDEDDDLKDITESVLAELEKVASPSNTEYKGVGSNSQPNNITKANGTSPVPHHNVMDRIKGEPVMTKGPTHDGYARETPPPVKAPTTLVKDVRKGNRRNSFKDTMGTVSDKGDASALLHKDFAGGPKPTKSIVDGKKSKG